MKAKSTLMIASLSLAFLMTFGVASAQAQCCLPSFPSCGCLGNVLAAPFVAAGYVVAGAVAVVSYPFTACCGCHVACFNPCNPCGAPAVSYAPAAYYSPPY
jgi:ABC-type sulfate transport system permease subunit